MFWYKMFYTSAAIFILGILLFFYLDTRVPEPVPEVIKVKMSDGLTKLCGNIISGLIAMGITTPFSPMVRKLVDWTYLIQVTGVPWGLGLDPHLQITETRMNGVPVKMYQPVMTLADDNRPVLVYFHGGGWSVLSTDSYDPFLRRLSRESEVVVISVEYRLSPQYPYPVPLQDCLQVVEYVIDHSEDLGFDPDKVAIGGDSAGGNIAAAISLIPQMSDKLAMQLLLVPVLQVVNWNTSSYIENIPYFHRTLNSPGAIVCVLNYLGLDINHFESFMYNRHTSVEFKKTEYKYLFDMNQYVPKHFIRSKTLQNEDWTTVDVGDTNIFKQIESKVTDPHIWPLMASDEELEDLPLTYILTAGYDVIRDDGIIFSERIKHINRTNVQHSHFPDGFHNSFMYSMGPFQCNVGHNMVSDIVNTLKTLSTMDL